MIAHSLNTIRPMTTPPNQGSAKGVADIVFLIDCTGSMQHCIDTLKNTIRTFFNRLGDQAGGVSPIRDWRASIVGYRDLLHDGTDWLEMNPFTAEVSEVESQLDSLEARGGGDAPESFLDALYEVVSRKEAEKGEPHAPGQWRSRHDARRVVVFFTDAVFHEKISTQGAAGGGVGDVITLMQSKRMVLFGFCPEWSGYESLAEFDGSEIEFVGDPDTAGEELEKLTGDHARFGELLMQLAKSISKSAAVAL